MVPIFPSYITPILSPHHTLIYQTNAYRGSNFDTMHFLHICHQLIVCRCRISTRSNNRQFLTFFQVKSGVGHSHFFRFYAVVKTVVEASVDLMTISDLTKIVALTRQNQIIFFS